jgi:hypothetical protein
MDWLLSQGVSFIPERYRYLVTATAIILVVADHVAAHFGIINGNSTAQVAYNGIAGLLSGIIKKGGVDLGDLGRPDTAGSAAPTELAVAIGRADSGAGPGEVKREDGPAPEGTGTPTSS